MLALAQNVPIHVSVWTEHVYCIHGRATFRAFHPCVALSISSCLCVKKINIYYIYVHINIFRSTAVRILDDTPIKEYNAHCCPDGQFQNVSNVSEHFRNIKINFKLRNRGLNRSFWSLRSFFRLNCRLKIMLCIIVYFEFFALRLSFGCICNT